MMGFAGSTYALFALVWAVMCGLSSAVVTDAMLRGTPQSTLEQAADEA